MSYLTASLRTAALAAALLVPPATQADDYTRISRDTGVGLHIAAQGNQALQAIRADLRRALRAWRPALPARPMTVSDPVPKKGAGGAVTVAPTQLCAK
jgi:hypothetical protein